MKTALQVRVPFAHHSSSPRINFTTTPLFLRSKEPPSAEKIIFNFKFSSTLATPPIVASSWWFILLFTWSYSSQRGYLLPSQSSSNILFTSPSTSFTLQPWSVFSKGIWSFSFWNQYLNWQSENSQPSSELRPRIWYLVRPNLRNNLPKNSAFSCFFIHRYFFDTSCASFGSPKKFLICCFWEKPLLPLLAFPSSNWKSFSKTSTIWEVLQSLKSWAKKEVGFSKPSDPTASFTQLVQRNFSSEELQWWQEAVTGGVKVAVVVVVVKVLLEAAMGSVVWWWWWKKQRWYHLFF